MSSSIAGMSAVTAAPPSSTGAPPRSTLSRSPPTDSTSVPPTPDPPDPRRSLRELLDDGATVLVDADDLAALGLDPRRLLDRTEPMHAAALAQRRPDYDGVWFL